MRATTTMAMAAWLALAGGAWACPFCTQMGKSLADEVKQAPIVFYGKLLESDQDKETSKIEVVALLKDDPTKALTRRKTIVIQKWLDPMTLTDKDRVLLFCEEYKGKIDAFRGIVVKKGSKLPDYVKGAIARKDKPLSERLRFHFDYLDDTDAEVSNDAYKEFANCDYRDIKAMAKTLPSARILKWLKDPATPSFRFGLYANLLGHCGKPADAKVLEAILDDPERRTSGIPGLLAACVMLQPKEGFARVTAILKDPKEDFMTRFAALRSLRFLHDYRPDLIGKKRLAAAATLLLPQDDISDMAIDDLRKWKAWDAAAQVLALRKTKAYDEVAVIKRAMLRYCLQCQGNAEAKAYVAARRKADAESVKDAEELLQLEAESAKPAVKATPKK